MRKILVPLDGSARAAGVLPAAAAFARALGNELLLLRVVTPEQATRGCRVTAADDEAAQAAACADLAQVAAALRRPDLPVTIATAFGHPATRIVEIVRHDPCITRIVLAARDTGAAPDRVFGRTTEEILRMAGVPILLVRGGQILPSLAAGSLVLVPFDGTALARQALDEASSIAAAAGATLLLVPTLAPLAYLPLAQQTAAWFIEAGQREANRITREVAQITRRIAATGLPVRSQAAPGQSAAEIAGLAATSGAALIVLAACGHAAGCWDQVALAALRLAATPVLLAAQVHAHVHAAADELGLLAVPS